MNRPARFAPPGSARLFSDADSPGASAGVYLANIDGASRGNPGPASYAVVVRDPDGKIALELAKKIGRTTNNVAEYYALLAALDYATNENIAALRVQSDSELLVRQMQGRYKVKSPELKPLFERASKLARQIQYFKIEHVRRELNRDADALANMALDSGEISTVTPSVKMGGDDRATPPPLASRTESRQVGAGEPRTPASSSSLLSSSPSTLSPLLPRRRIRARFVRGVLVPSEPLDLPEGTEVVADIRSSNAE